MIDLKKIYNKYNLKREYIILLLPALIAVILLVIIIVLPSGQENTGYISEEGFTNASKEVTITKDQGVYKNLDQVLVFAVLIAIIPYSIDVYLARRRIRRYEEEYIGFLYELSELLRGGLDPLNAIKEIASPAIETERGLHALSPHLKKAAAQTEWGVSFESVIASMAESLKSPLISKYSKLIVQASRLGAISPAIILKSADDLEKTLQLEHEKEAALKEYLFIIYAAQFILIGLIYILNSSLLPSILNMFKMGTGGGTSFGIAAPKMNLASFKVGFFHVIMINAFASGIIAGQLTEGKARYGLRHSVILILISYTASLAFLLR
ncbi:Type II secretion system (T2SS), protein F [uncultured archaeon]|nr:Type II secretion system (T2SS), protein F [uncultured archaeon]